MSKSKGFEGIFHEKKILLSQDELNILDYLRRVSNGLLSTDCETIAKVKNLRVKKTNEVLETLIQKGMVQEIRTESGIDVYVITPRGRSLMAIVLAKQEIKGKK